MPDVIVNSVVSLSMVNQSSSYRNIQNSRRFYISMMFEEGSTGTGDG